MTPDAAHMSHSTGDAKSRRSNWLQRMYLTLERSPLLRYQIKRAPRDMSDDTKHVLHVCWWPTDSTRAETSTRLPFSDTKTCTQNARRFCAPQCSRRGFAPLHQTLLLLSTLFCSNWTWLNIRTKRKSRFVHGRLNFLILFTRGDEVEFDLWVFTSLPHHPLGSIL